MITALALPNAEELDYADRFKKEGTMIAEVKKWLAIASIAGLLVPQAQLAGAAATCAMPAQFG